MLSYCGLSLGIMLAQLKTLPFLAASLLVSSSLLILAATLFYLNRLTYTTKVAIIALSLLIFGYSYASLRIKQRLDQLIRFPIYHLEVNGYLTSPVNSYESINQAELRINSGQFKNQNVLISYPNTFKLSSGTNYRLDLSLQPLAIPHNYAALDYQQYLIAKNIIARASLNQIIRPLARSYAPVALINDFRSNLIKYMQQSLTSQKYAGLAVALVTGYRQLIPKQQWPTFKNSGLMHLISISGLHITLITSLAISLAGALYRFLPGISRYPKQLIFIYLGLSVALFYSLLAGFNIPTQRSFYLFLLMAAFTRIRRQIPLLNKLVMSLSLVLVIDPFACLSSGFWLSFTLVATIFAISQTYRRRLSKFKLWLLLQLSLLLASLPLCLYIFYSYPPIAIIANLWAIPLLANLITPFLLASSLLHFTWLLQLASKLISFIMLPIEQLARLMPYTQITPNLSLMLISYFGIILLLLPSSLKGKNLLGFTLFIILAMQSAPEKISYGHLKVTIFVNPQLDIALVQSSQQRLMVVMLAAGSNLELLNNVILPYLQSWQIRHLNYLIINQINQQNDILSFLKQNQIKVDNLLISNEVKFRQLNFDGIELTLAGVAQQLGLELSSAEGNTYLSNGLAPIHFQEWQNLVILLPLNPLNCLDQHQNRFKQFEWVYQNPTTNLIFNYPPCLRQQAKGNLENLNLRTTNIYDLTRHGSIEIFNNSVTRDKRLTGKEDTLPREWID